MFLPRSSPHILEIGGLPCAGCATKSFMATTAIDYEIVWNVVQDELLRLVPLLELVIADS